MQKRRKKNKRCLSDPILLAEGSVRRLYGVCFRVEWAECAHNVVKGKANLSTFCKEGLNGLGGVYESCSQFCHKLERARSH
jgi:hypothetical protein